MSADDVLTIRVSRYAMACEFEVVLCGEDKRFLADVGEEVLGLIERLDEQLSVFRPASEVSYINVHAAREAVRVEPELFELLVLAHTVHRETGGAFDVTSGPVVELWRESEDSGKEPDRKAIEAAAAKVGMSHILLNPSTNSVWFDTEGISINLGAIGKGYAVERAAALIEEYAIGSALVSAGKSTIRALGDQPGSRGWNVGIRHPSKVDERVLSVALRDEAMATSGGPGQKDAEIEERFEHIVDPRSGLQAQSSVVSASVVCGNAALADALSTAFYLGGPKLAESYVRGHAGVRAIFVHQFRDGYAVTDVPRSVGTNGGLENAERD